MTSKYVQTVFSDAARTLQTLDGSRSSYSAMEARSDGSNDGLTPREIQFLQARDSFYMASVTGDGWPYVQHRGGPKGFLKALSDHQIGFADLKGNRQFVSAGNVQTNKRVSLIMVDYPARRRLKIAGHARYSVIEDAPDLAAALTVPGSQGVVQAVFLIDVVAYDWNCPQFITPRWTLDELTELTGEDP